MRCLWSALLVLLFATPSLAQEPVGCDKFKWPIERERAMLTNAAVPTVASGATVADPLASAVVMTLSPLVQAHLPVPPERAPKNETFAGFANFAAPPRAGIYAISLSSGAWIDLVQAGNPVKSGQFSGALGCDGIRKSVRFQLGAEPFIVQITGARTPKIGVVVSPAAK